MGLLKSICAAAVLALATAAHAGAADAPAATRMIVNAGHKLAFHVIPGRSPAIVLDAGGGLDSSYWAALAPEIARRTGSKVITYDRAGMGASEEVKGPWNLDAATDDLAAGLKTLGATRDVILVSHSIAGEVATYLAIRHPSWLKGVVMVDANVPDFYTEDLIKGMSAAYAPLIANLKTAPPSATNRQLLAVSESFEETSRAFHKAVWPASVPAIVIVAEQTPFAEDPAVAELWREAHRQFVKGAANRTYVTAEKSSHDVVHDRPDVIVKAILDLAAR
jgi:pimeloyl-ACP methyl ester carboxylesterase